MARIPEKAVNAHIPEGVFDALDALIADMPPYSKKMIVGAAIGDWLGRPAVEQWDSLEAYVRAHYRGPALADDRPASRRKGKR